ncbi:Serine protease inhibitor Kazal-type 6 [Varanus komodoensis]|nr:Serine protease inhibitor Kazal-type 6 [Varanus komodoensis]
MEGRLLEGGFTASTWCLVQFKDQSRRTAAFSQRTSPLTQVAPTGSATYVYFRQEQNENSRYCHASELGFLLHLLRDKVRSLGVLLDPELTLEVQVTAVARSAFFPLWLIHQLHPYLENDCLATVTHALVTSRLDFCNALYVGLPLKTVRILQLVQNRAARLLTGTGRYVHMTPVLRQLHWLPIEVRAQFKVLVMTYKALNGLGPGYLKECSPDRSSWRRWEATPAGRQSIDCSEFQNKVAYCTRESSPHCGTDGHTYGNKCAFCKAVERSSGRLALLRMGKC